MTPRSCHCCLMPIQYTKTDMVHLQNDLTEESGTDLRFDPPSVVHMCDVTPCPLYACIISDELVHYVSETSSGLVGPLLVQGTVV